MMINAWWLSLSSALLFFNFITAHPFDINSSANLSTTWTNGVSLGEIDRGSSRLRSILPISSPFGSEYACGFYCNGNCDAYFFGVILMDSTNFMTNVWSANWNKPVQFNASLKLTSEGDLVLRDVDGTLVWSSNTSSKSVAGMNLMETGNLVLFDVNNSIVWQSFDDPRDTWILGQRLLPGQKLVSSISDTNWTEGTYSLLVTDYGLVGLMKSNPPQVYLNVSFELGFTDNVNYIEFGIDNSSAISINVSGSLFYSIPAASSARFIRLDPDGHLKAYTNNPTPVADVSDSFLLSECKYPMVCGKYGICTNGQCTCPETRSVSPNYFSPSNGLQPSLGCFPRIPVSCNASQFHHLVELQNVTYFTFRSHIKGTTVQGCREACLGNCSCKAAFFSPSVNRSFGDCYLPPEIFSLELKEAAYYSMSSFVKVQLAPNSTTTSPRKNSNRSTILGAAIGGSLLLIITIGFMAFIVRKKYSSKDHGDYLDMPGLTSRFSYEELKLATNNFSRKLGEGGFGAVFEGLLKDDTKVAVKYLKGIDHISKSFLAEVESIGSIHHINLVRLIGFCAEKSHRLLVYEYMANGSLDRWIYNKEQDIILDWKCRRKIIHDVAKGLTYLHEDCRQKIIHLDIKPQNILLNENWEAKLADFGLSKLIDRHQSEVVTSMRGTPGYLAPEWLNAIITEKADVYSFGVVVLEILCGRKNFDRAEPEEYRLLLSVFKMKAEEGRLTDLIDKRSKDMQSHETEVVDMFQVAAWCLQYDRTKRPSMSEVVKVLEGVMDVRKELDYTFLISQISAQKTPVDCYVDATPLLPSLLSGPR